MEHGRRRVEALEWRKRTLGFVLLGCYLLGVPLIAVLIFWWYRVLPAGRYPTVLIALPAVPVVAAIMKLREMSKATTQELSRLNTSTMNF